MARLRSWVSAGLLLLYIGSDLALRSIAFREIGVIPWYPSAGLALAILVISGPRWAPALLLSRLLLYLSPPPGASIAYAPVWVVFLEAALQVAAYAAAASIIRKRVLSGLAVWRIRHAAWLIGALATSAFLGGLVSALQSAWTRGLSARDFLHLVAAFAAGDTAGALIVLPALLMACRPLLGVPTANRRIAADDQPGTSEVAGPDTPLAPRPSRAERVAEVASVLAAILLSGVLFASAEPGVGYARLVCLMPLVWVAVREGMEGAALVLATYGLACLVMTAVGTIHPSQGPELQSWLLTLGVVGLLLGTARTESAESTARYWHLLATASEGVWRVDPKGRTLYLNARMAEILGRSPADVIGHEVRDLIAPEERARWDEQRRLRAEGDDTIYQTNVLLPDGTRRPVLVRGSVARSTTGAAVGAVALVTDLSQLRAAEAERERAQVLLEAAFRSSRDAMVLFRASDGLIVDVNAVWCEMTGHSRDEVIGRSHEQLGIWGDSMDAHRLADAIREHGAVRDLEIAFQRQRADGAKERRHARVSVVPAEAGGVTYFLVTARDVTAERRREDAERQLRRLEELGRLAGSVSHDFNNLLTVILAYTQFVKASAESGAPVSREDLEEIERAVTRGQGLTRRLLAFSRHQAIEQQVLDLGNVVEGAQGMLRSVLGPTELRVERTATPLPVIADATQIDQVLLNLAVNARDAMPNGGTFTIATNLVHAPPGEVADLIGPDALPGDYAVLRAQDTGAGMDEATQSRIFEPFFTTKESGAGTGLGLAVVFGVVRQARGAIRVDSAPGQGSTFTIFWPLASPDAVVLPAARVTPAGLRASAGGRVLLVEDQEGIREIARRVLEQAGYEVHAAANGAVALDRLAELEAAGTLPDVVLSDVTMPEMGGRALAERLAERAPQVPVILMSGNVGARDPRVGLPNVVGPVVEKPFQVAQLLATVQDVVAQSRTTGFR